MILCLQKIGVGFSGVLSRMLLTIRRLIDNAIEALGSIPLGFRCRCDSVADVDVAGRSAS